jgi:toluene monooxygenase system ferredoxin subunit
MAFERICSLDDLWEGEMREFSVRGRRVLVVHAEGGTVSAFAALCPHQAFPLVEGKLEGTKLTCAAHLWEFDAVTGSGLNPKDCALRRYEAKVENGEVHVDTARVLAMVA